MTPTAWNDRAEALQISDLAKSHEDFRQRVTKKVHDSLRALVPHFSAKASGGYSYAPDAWDEIERACEALMVALAEGKTQFSPATRAEVIARIKAAFARHDPALQDLLKRVQTSGLPDEGSAQP